MLKLFLVYGKAFYFIPEFLVETKRLINKQQ
jgi:hypothetical protein